MDEPKLKGWNHAPGVPLRVSPFFTFPFKPSEMLKWIANSWFQLTQNTIVLAFAAISFFYFQPSLEVARNLEWGWIIGLYGRNVALMVLVAGGLHLYFYSFSKQGLKLKYDPRPLMKNGKQFTLGGQVRDNMFWTLTSGVGFWTFYEVIIFWAMANGYAPVISFAQNPIWFISLIFLIPVWESFYFYWIHRALHIPFLYKHVHSLHHRNINVGPWSGLSMHPIEHLIYLGSIMIHWIIPASPFHILYHMQYITLTAASTHTGFEGWLFKDKNRLKLGTFHHQMHHRYFECNYGSLEVPWDKLFGSFHDGTEESNERMKERRKRFQK